MSIRCHYCNSDKTQVKDSRPMVYGFTNAIRRRLECFACGKKFTSVETSNTHELQETAVHLTGVINRLKPKDIHIIRMLLASFLNCDVKEI